MVDAESGTGPKPEGNWLNFWYCIFFIIAVILHLIDIQTRMSGQAFRLFEPRIFILYLSYSLFISLTPLFKFEGKKPLAGWPPALTISTIAYFVPLAVALVSWLGAFLPDIAQFITQGVASGVAWFAPAWIIYLFYFASEKVGQGQGFVAWLARFFRTWIGITYLITWLLILIFTFNAQILDVAALSETTANGIQPGIFIQDAYVYVGNGLQDTLHGMYRLYNSTTTSFQQGIELAAYGDVYTGRVEQQQNRKLGVYMEELQALDKTVLTGNAFSVFTTINAETLDTPIKISLSCGCCGEQEGSIQTGFVNHDKYTCSTKPGACEIKPKAEFTVTTMDQRQADCKFKKGMIMEKGLKTVSLNAQFTFTTQAFLRTYFMDAERIRAFKAEKINPLTQYGIKDQQPIAIYTPGPVNIGMGISENLPLQIDREDSEKTIVLGITLRNTWAGKLLKINSVNIIIPSGFQLTELNSYDFDSATCSQEPLGTGIICPVPAEFLKTPEGQAPLNFRVYVTAPRSTYGQVLGTEPLAVRFFKTSIDYTYQLTQQTTVLLKDTQTQIP